ncbi:MAG: DUF6048 family protein [Bacteroidales bacterium]|nr:DUF6048 family protein [Bacteroidales bacterium]
MWKTYAYIISFLIVLVNTQIRAQEQPDDSVIIPLKIKAGIEVSGPVIYFTDKNILSTEGYISVDLNEKLAVYAGVGYSDFKYSQYNYSYLNKGIFIKAGVDFNMLKPEISMGKYWAGIGLRYGLSTFIAETPSFWYKNYWGTVLSSLGTSTRLGHFLEVSPGVRVELFRNFSIGWSVSLRRLIYSGTSKDLRPIYFPGYGSGAKPFSTGISYFMVFNIPFKKIKVEIKKEIPEETEETTETEDQISIQGK